MVNRNLKATHKKKKIHVPRISTLPGNINLKVVKTENKKKKEVRTTLDFPCYSCLYAY